jgi:hypothetical protein
MGRTRIFGRHRDFGPNKDSRPRCSSPVVSETLRAALLCHPWRLPREATYLFDWLAGQISRFLRPRPKIDPLGYFDTEWTPGPCLTLPARAIESGVIVTKGVGIEGPRHNELR